ncbi:MAG: sugar ABC transporter permease [Betaproteobacteria bacterium]
MAGSRSRRERITAFLMLLPCFVVIIGFYLYPTMYNLEISLTDLSLLKLRQGGNFVGMANYREFFTNDQLWTLVLNTVFWLTFVTVALRLLLGLAIALLIQSERLKRWRMTAIVRLALIIPWAIPPIVAVAVWRWLLDPTVGPVNRMLVSLGLIDNPVAFFANLHTVWPSIVTIVVWNTVPIATISILAALQAIPLDLYEAAGLDGADQWQKFRFITLPWLVPTLSVLALMSTIWTFNNFVYVWLATGAGPGTYTNVLATEIYIRAFTDTRFGYSAAIGVVMAVAMAALGAVYFKTFGARAIDERVG